MGDGDGPVAVSLDLAVVLAAVTCHVSQLSRVTCPHLSAASSSEMTRLLPSSRSLRSRRTTIEPAVRTRGPWGEHVVMKYVVMSSVALSPSPAHLFPHEDHVAQVLHPALQRHLAALLHLEHWAC